MPAKDLYHNSVKNALIKDGWTITADSYTIKYKDIEVFADLAAEKILAAHRGSEKIVVEIKSFLSPSPIRDFEMALGQYILYRNLIALTNPEYRLYLAIIEAVYVKNFSREAIKEVAALNELKLIVVDLDKEEIIQWIR